MITIYDKKTNRGNFDNNGLGVLDECLSANIIHELNGDYSLELEYPVLSRKVKHLQELNIIKAEDQLFRIYKVERIQDRTSKVKVWARHIFYDLAFYFIESARILNANMKEALEGTMPPEMQGYFSFDALEENIAPFAAKEINGVDALFRLIGVYGGEVKRDNFNIEIKEKVGENTGVLIKYGKNIKGMKVIEDTGEIATKIYPVGGNNLILPERYVEVSSDSGKLLDFPITKKVEFKECKDVESLRRKAKEYAKKAAELKIFITIDFLQLSKTEEYKNYKHLNNVNIGDRVRVEHERLATRTELRVIKKRIDLLNPINTKIELGDPLKTIIEKLDTSKLLQEINEAITGTLSSVIIKKNSDKITISTSSYPAMIIGISTKADTNLNCNITMTGKASEDCSVQMLFSLDGKYYDFKPIQKLASGDNIIGLPLPMPQVTAGNHSFMVEMKVTNGTFTMEKNNLQVSIEGRDLEGGLSASVPRAEVVYSFLYKLFKLKLGEFSIDSNYSFNHISDVESQTTQLMKYNYYKSKLSDNEVLEGVADVTLTIMGIIEELSKEKSKLYLYDNRWVDWDFDFDKNKDGTYDYYSRATIKEPILIEEGNYINDLGEGVIYSVRMPDKTEYKTLLSVSTNLEKK